MVNSKSDHVFGRDKDETCLLSSGHKSPENVKLTVLPSSGQDFQLVQGLSIILEFKMKNHGGKVKFPFGDHKQIQVDLSKVCKKSVTVRRTGPLTQQ